MGSIGRHIFRTTLVAFLAILASVTTLLWMTQGLRNIDIITNEGQTIFVFIGITGLIIPLLVLLIAPIALTLAVAYVLHKLGDDSELIVMNAAGMPPRRIFAPFLAVRIGGVSPGRDHGFLRLPRVPARPTPLGYSSPLRDRHQ